MLRNRYEKGGAAMTRQEAVDRLCDVYAGSYDVTRCEENEHALAATMVFLRHRREVRALQKGQALAGQQL